MYVYVLFTMFYKRFILQLKGVGERGEREEGSGSFLFVYKNAKGSWQYSKESATRRKIAVFELVSTLSVPQIFLKT